MVAPLKTLIVEDSAIDAELLVIALKAAGFEPEWRRVDTETDVRAALVSSFDLVFSDFCMPHLSAFRVLQLLHESRLETPCIIVSGTIGEEQVVETLKSGAVDYVSKDRLDRLSLVVRRAVREARERAERRLAEEQVRQAELALRATQDTLKRVLAHSPSVIYSLHYKAGQLTPVWVSENIRQLFGYENERVCSPEWWFQHVHPEDLQLVLKEDPQLQSSGHWTHEYRVRHADGSYRWISDEKRLVRDTAGNPAEVVGVWTDVTDRKQLEAQLRQAQKLESIGQLAGGVAHDFNNILTVIQGHAALLLSNRSLAETAQESAQQIALASERAATLTRQLLTFSRKQVMQPRALDLNEVVDNVSKMLKRILREDVSLQVKYGSKLPLIHADAGMLEQVIINLAVNARDAMPNGGELRISTSHEEIGTDYVHSRPDASTGKFVRLVVADGGSGIAPDVLPRIFEPFFTTKAVGQGTGLGLATVHGIVHQHRGWIDVASQLGVGTTFEVYFPALKGHSEHGRQSPEEQPAPGGTETILLVEDEEPVRTLARHVLERKGYTVIEAISAVAALQNWNQHAKVDLVLTDMVMPGGMTGLELIKRLRAELPSLSAIITSGYSVEIVGKDLELRDGVNFLQKPYGPRRLAQSVRDALDQNRARLR